MGIRHMIRNTNLNVRNAERRLRGNGNIVPAIVSKHHNCNMEALFEQFEIALFGRKYPSTLINGKLWSWHYDGDDVVFHQWKILYNYIKGKK